jgi:hypothetical protein
MRIAPEEEGAEAHGMLLWSVKGVEAGQVAE